MQRLQQFDAIGWLTGQPVSEAYSDTDKVTGTLESYVVGQVIELYHYSLEIQFGRCGGISIRVVGEHRCTSIILQKGETRLLPMAKARGPRRAKRRWLMVAGCE